MKMFLMWNSKMLIYGDGDATVATSLLEASNLVVLRVSSSIHSASYFALHMMLSGMKVFSSSLAGIFCHTFKC